MASKRKNSSQRAEHVVENANYVDWDIEGANIEMNKEKVDSDEPMLVTNVVKQGSESVDTYKPRQFRSVVWKHFDRPQPKEEEEQLAICKYCQKVYKAGSSNHGTTTLRLHISKCKGGPNKKDPKDNYTISFDGESSTNLMKIHKFNASIVRNALVEWIVCEELPFRIVESVKFRAFCKAMEPRFEVPSRVTIAREVFKLYSIERNKLRLALKGNISRVSLTTDMWTSSKNTSYMCVTAHFIDKSWQLHKRIISFSIVDDHRGEGIGKQLEKVTKEWGIEKIMCITVDNASANEGAVDWIKKYGSNHLLQGEYLHVRCFAHILNIIVKYGLQKCDMSIESIRTAVKYVRSSPKRQVTFDECVRVVGI